MDRKGTARLFLSIGRADGFDPRKLCEMLKRECGLTDRKIDDVRIMDNCSFVTIPFSDAREAIRRLNDIHKGGRPIAELAKPGTAPGGGKERRERFDDRKREHGDKSRRSFRKDAPAKAPRKAKKSEDVFSMDWDAIGLPATGKGKKGSGWGGKAGYAGKPAGKRSR